MYFARSVWKSHSVLGMCLQFETLFSYAKGGLVGISGYKIKYLLFSCHGIYEAFGLMMKLDSVLLEEQKSLRFKKRKEKKKKGVKVNLVLC